MRSRGPGNQAPDPGPDQRGSPAGCPDWLQYLHDFHCRPGRSRDQPGAVPGRSLLQPVTVYPRRRGHSARRHCRRHGSRFPRAGPRGRQADRRCEGRYGFCAQPPAVRAVPRSCAAGGAGHRNSGRRRHPGAYDVRLPLAVLWSVRDRGHGRFGCLQLLLQVPADRLPGAVCDAEDPVGPRGGRQTRHQDRCGFPQRPRRAHPRTHRVPEQGLCRHAKAHRRAWPGTHQLTLSQEKHMTFPAERTAIVTGAVSEPGIGRPRATVNYLAAQGWNIGIIDLDDAACKAAAKEVAAEYGVQAHGVGANVASEAEVRAAIDELEAELPQIVALANVAGVSSPIGYLELEPAEWGRVLSINLNGVHYATRRVAESMVKNRIGRIVNISSVSAQRGGGTFSKTPYSVAKAGVIGLTRATARELGEYDITVNPLSPGPIDTDIMGGTLSEERKDELTKDLVVNRVGSTRDIAAAIAFLISEASGYLSGQTLNVDGGLYMH